MIKGWKKINARPVPIKLNKTWITAERLASAQEPKEAIIASTVDPIFEPRVIAQAVSQVTILLKARVITMAVKALDECIKAVITTPVITLKKIDQIPQLCIVPIKESFEASKLNTSESPLNPIKSRPNPITASPIFLLLESFINVIKKPRPKIGIAKVEILKLKPNKETIQAVIVVPILAPKITPTDCFATDGKIYTFTRQVE